MSNDQTRAHLLGTWKLLSAVREDVSSGAKTDLLGANPIGYINYANSASASAAVALPVTGLGRSPPTLITIMRPSGRSMTSYAGTYTIDGSEITHHVDVSWNESCTGTRQKRFARFEGNRVYLSSPPSPDPVTGRTSVRTMTWEKVG